MSLILLAQDSATGTTREISQLVTSIVWETMMQDQPGKLTFSYLQTPDLILSEGSLILFKQDDTGIFYGYVFKRTVGDDLKVTITAYDQMRYLKNKDTYVLSALTASGVFEKICIDQKLKYSIISPSSYVIPANVQDNKAYYEMIQRAIDMTIINAGEWKIIYDNFGTLEFNDVNNLKTLICLNDGSTLTGFSYESGIDSDTFNQIKVIKENADTKKRDIYIAKDGSNIAKWGTLQYFEKVTTEANAAQLQKRADDLLKSKNRVTQELTLVAIGDLRLRAGSGIILDIADLESFGFVNKRYYMVTECKHTFQDGVHAMQLKVRLV